MTRAQRRAAAGRELSVCQAAFAATRNPIWAWEAVAVAADAGAALPGWVFDYLRGVAVEIAELSRSNVPRKGKLAVAVYQAVGFEPRGRANPFKELGKAGHEIGVAYEVFQLHEKNRREQLNGTAGVGTYDWKTIFKLTAAEHRRKCDCAGMGWKTVERYWRLHALAVIPPALVKKARSQKLDAILR